MNENILKVENISKEYKDKVGYVIQLLENISFSVFKGEFVSVLAPKGSGKTSLLKIIARLENPSSGKIIEEKKNIVFIPSKPSSFPWLNVYDNISFNSKMNEKEIAEIINLVGLHGYENHFPNAKSEGFRFRISLGRTLANNPDLIIIDEPFNNLNDKTREEIYLLLRKVFIEKKISILFGTTNITEALFLSDKIYLMKKNPGEIIEKLKVELSAKRNLEILESEQFQSSRNQIEDIFKKKLESKLYHFSV
ncbi:MAG: ABC transporter ATP-binding protein [Ignavibacteriae bacterium]|nr:ABC transporter ATP-binding protein [Ignavibacteriota bacterium]